MNYVACPECGLILFQLENGSTANVICYKCKIRLLIKVRGEEITTKKLPKEENRKR